MRTALAVAIACVLAAGGVLLAASVRQDDRTAHSAPAAARAGVAERGLGPAGSQPSIFEASRSDIASNAIQDYQYYPYDARLTFVRIRPAEARGNRGGWGVRGNRDPPWRHDYPTAEHNLSKIVRELTFVRMRVENWGGNVLTLEDPRLMQFPLAYMSEPGFWTVTPGEADALRAYLLKGGFIIFDDFGGNQGRYDMENLAQQMARVLPELQWVRLDATAAIFDSFFQIDPDNLALAGDSYRGVPVFYGMFEGNDQVDGRLLAIAADAGDFGDFWEFSETGYYPVDISNEAYKVGINYIVYALTH
ncbi:MAG TPA: DUF4159 domain-containing protein [Longimicrobiales bacterium]|nr:DUF4159 domain-containing protein [Longimicrobiales bacterium]